MDPMTKLKMALDIDAESVARVVIMMCDAAIAKADSYEVKNAIEDLKIDIAERFIPEKK